MRLAIAACFLLLAVAAGCGENGESDLTVDEYFDRLAGIEIDIGRRSQEFITASAAATPLHDEISDAERITLARERFEEVISLQRDYLQRVRDLDPPREVADPHNAFVDAMRDVVEWIKGFVESDAFREFFIDLTTAASIDELRRAYEITGDPDVFERLSEACADLTAAAADLGIELDLDCD